MKHIGCVSHIPKLPTCGALKRDSYGPCPGTSIALVHISSNVLGLSFPVETAPADLSTHDRFILKNGEMLCVKTIFFTFPAFVCFSWGLERVGVPPAPFLRSY